MIALKSTIGSLRRFSYRLISPRLSMKVIAAKSTRPLDIGQQDFQFYSMEEHQSRQSTLKSVLDKHYETVVLAYDNPDLFFKSSMYEKWIMGKTLQHFDFNERKQSSSDPKGSTFVDLGCGNGRFSSALLQMIPAPCRPDRLLCVDPSPELLEVAATQELVSETVCASALSFARMSVNADTDADSDAGMCKLESIVSAEVTEETLAVPSPDADAAAGASKMTRTSAGTRTGAGMSVSYKYLLMKEMVHHIPAVHRVTVFRGLYEQLEADGRLVIITRPVETDYPFFPRIKEIWRTTQPPREVFVESLETAGFTVTVSDAELPVRVSTAGWLSFIGNRTWSEFSMCTAGEMDEGLRTLQTQLKGKDCLDFTEKLIFIVARKA